MNRAEYNDVVARYADELYSFALRYCNISGAAEDAVQDCFVALWERRADVAASGAKGWLIRVLYRRLVDMHRHDERLRYTDASHDVDAIDAGSSFDMKDAVSYALSQLTDQQRTLVLLRDLQGYDYAEIADICSLSEQQVAVYLYRARKALKKLMEDYR